MGYLNLPSFYYITHGKTLGILKFVLNIWKQEKFTGDMFSLE